MTTRLTPIPTIVTLSEEDVLRLMLDLSDADLNHYTVRIAVDDDGLKWAIGAGVWTVGTGDLS